MVLVLPSTLIIVFLLFSQALGLEEMNSESGYGVTGTRSTKIKKNLSAIQLRKSLRKPTAQDEKVSDIMQVIKYHNNLMAGFSLLRTLLNKLQPGASLWIKRNRLSSWSTMSKEQRRRLRANINVL